MTEKSRTALRFESLETRDLLAPLLGITVNLYEDAGGQPGALIADDQVEQGDEFWVEILARDTSGRGQGVGGLWIDIDWNPDVIEADSAFNPADRENPVVTENFPVLRSGTLDNETGFIDELGGCRLRSYGAGQAIGVEAPEQFALLKFKAVGEAKDSTLDISVGSRGIGMTYTGRLTYRDIRIEQQTITVGANAVDAVMASDEHLADFATTYWQALQEVPQWARLRGLVKPMPARWIW